MDGIAVQDTMVPSLKPAAVKGAGSAVPADVILTPVTEQQQVDPIVEAKAHIPIAVVHSASPRFIAAQAPTTVLQQAFEVA